MEAAGSFQMLISIHQITQRHIPEDRDIKYCLVLMVMG
jgi:hypothetical protein